MDTVESWERFRHEWKDALKKHRAPYFHFRELNRNERAKSKSRFHGWTDKAVDDFIYDMAIVASRTAVPFGGGAAFKRMGPGTTNAEMFTTIFDRFFEDCTNTLNTIFPKFKGRVSFFFDDNKNEDWIAVLNTVNKSWQAKDKRIGEYTPVKMQEEIGMPCQAADLFAYVHRQQNERMYDNDAIQPSKVLDLIISRNAFPKSHPKHKFALLPEPQWRELVMKLRDHQMKMDATNRIMGTPNQPYTLYDHNALRKLFTINEMRTMVKLAKAAMQPSGNDKHPRQ